MTTRRFWHLSCNSFLSPSLCLLCYSLGAVLPLGPILATALEVPAERRLERQGITPLLPQPELPGLKEATAYLPDATLPRADEIYLVIKLRDRRVYVYRDQTRLASYAIAVGKPGWETPVGTFKVFSKEKNPIFKSFKTGKVIYPGPDNPLGRRWIGFWTDGKTQIGFHGTNQEELIGQAVSHGCVRMRNQDVTALFDQIEVGTVVKVQP